MAQPQFQNTHWQAVTAREMVVRGGTFKNSILQEVYFDNATFTNVRFENVTFGDVSFKGARLESVEFEGCTFLKASLPKLQQSTIEIIDSRLESVNLVQSQLNLKVKNSVFTDVGLDLLKSNSAIEFIDSQLDWVVLDGSKLASLVIRDSELEKTGARDATIDEVVLTDSHVSASFARSNIAAFTATNTANERLSFVEANVQHASIQGCRQGGWVVLGAANFGTVDIQDCDLDKLNTLIATGKRLVVKDSTIQESLFKGLTVDELELSNVTFVRRADFTSTQAKSLSPNNVQRSPTLQLITTDSNVEF